MVLVICSCADDVEEEGKERKGKERKGTYLGQDKRVVDLSEEEATFACAIEAWVYFDLVPEAEHVRQIIEPYEDHWGTRPYSEEADAAQDLRSLLSAQVKAAVAHDRRIRRNQRKGRLDTRSLFGHPKAHRKPLKVGQQAH